MQNRERKLELGEKKMMTFDREKRMVMRKVITVIYYCRWQFCLGKENINALDIQIHIQIA